MRAWVEVPAMKSGTDVTVLMDPDDYVALDGRRISIGSHGYAQVWERPKLLLLHRWIMGVPPGVRYRVVVDHIDRNVLDCRRANLRLVNATKSNLNRELAPRSLPIGVYRLPSGRFAAVIWRNYTRHNVGTFDTPEEAAAAIALVRPQLDRATARLMSPIACVRCDDTGGPFVRQPEGPVCEDCLDEQDGQ